MNNQAYYSTMLTIGGMYLLAKQQASEKLHPVVIGINATSSRCAVAKQRSQEAYFATKVGLNAAIEQWDIDHPEVNAKCNGTLLCEHTRTRHQSGCWSQR